MTGLLDYQGLPLPAEIIHQGQQLLFVLQLDIQAETVLLSPVQTADPTAPPPVGTHQGWFHPAGLRYSPPPEWRLHLEGALPALLTPGSGAPDGDELYLLVVGPARGITSLHDPRLRQQVDLLLNAPAGLFQGAIHFQPEGGDFTYQGVGRNGGGTVLGQLWFAQPTHLLVAVLAVGLPQRIQGRGPEIRR